MNLAVSNISGIPPAFGLPDQKSQFLAYARAHPEKYPPPFPLLGPI